MRSFNERPYFDDFENAEAANYYGPLFIPGRPVQARELNQIQSTFRSQIQRFGDHFFRHGAMVVPGQLAIDPKAEYVRLQPTYGTVGGSPIPIDLSQFEEQIIVGDLSGLRAQVLHVVPAADGNADTLYVKYLDGGRDGKQIRFLADELLKIDETVNMLAQTFSSAPSGQGVTAQIEQGTYYIFGIFARVDKQFLVVDAYNNVTDARIGLNITENFVTYEDDPNLFDNSTGVPNPVAPGADRYQIILTLAKKAIDSTDDENFVELARIKDSIKQKFVDKTEYSIVADENARSIKDLAGDFTKRAFGLDIREHLDASFITSGTGLGGSAAVSFIPGVRATATANLSGGAITAINVVDGGSGYPFTAVNIVGDGIGAVAYATVVANKVTAITVINGGTGYTVANIQIQGVGSAAAANATITSGVITSITVTNQGNGYAANPTVTITGDGAGASAVAIVNGGVVSAISVSTAGSSYTVANVSIAYAAAPISQQAAYIQLGAGASTTDGEYVGYYVQLMDGTGAGQIRKIIAYEGVNTKAFVDTDWDVLKVPDTTTKYKVFDASNINSGIYEPPTGQEDQLAVGLERGKAYVNGYPVETLVTTYIDMDKARDTQLINNTAVPTPLGNYIYVKNIYNSPLPPTNSVSKDYLLASIMKIKATGSLSGGDVIGTCRFRDIEYFAGDPDVANNAIYKAFIFDIQMAAGYTIDDARSYFVSSSSTNNNNAVNAYGDILVTYSLFNVNGTGLAGSGDVTQNTGGTPTETIVSFDSANNVLFTQPKTGNPAHLSGSGFLYGPSSTSAQISNRSVLQEAASATLIFPLAQEMVKTLQGSGGYDTSYSVRRTLQAAENGSGQYVFTTPVNEVFIGPNDNFVAVIVDAVDSDDIGKHVDLPAPLMGGSPANSSMTFTPSTGSVPLDSTIKLTCTVNKETVIPKSKTLIEGQVVEYNVATNIMSLYKADVYRISAILDSNAVGVSVGNASTPIDITDRYLFSNGQTDSYYGIGFVQLRTGATPPVGAVRIVYDYFEHSGTGDYFCADSYLNQIPYANIPGYTTNSGVVLALRDCLDFRPRIADNGATGGGATATAVIGTGPNAGKIIAINITNGGSGYSVAPILTITGDGASATATTTISGGIVTAVTITNQGSGYTSASITILPVTTGVVNFAGYGSNYSETPQPNGLARADFEFYLARIDKIYVTQKGEFKITKGTSSINPLPPADPTDGMMLYTIYLNPYTLSTKDLRWKMTDNRGFTMRDIAGIVRRVENLEYYTSLNLLEKEASTFSIVDPATGTDRFKNGFIVDNFKGTGVGDVFDNDFHCSIDRKAGAMRPEFLKDNIGMTFQPTLSSGYTISNDIITLPYTDLKVIEQPFATKIINVNPFAVFGWNGSVTLSPGTDTWYDTQRRPDVMVTDDSALDGLKFGSNPNGIMWGDWRTDWVGESVVTEKLLDTNLSSWNPNSAFGTEIFGTRRAATDKDKLTIAQQGAADPRLVNGPQFLVADILQTIQVTSDRQVQQSRTGIQTTVIPKVDRTIVNDRVLSISQVPYMRTKTVQIQGRMFKPLTRLYAFFDNVDVNEYVRPYNPNTTTYGDFNAPIITDGVGNFQAEFDIPNNDKLSFRVGSRTLRMTSSLTNGNDAETFGDATYTASGLLEVRQNTITSVRVPEFQFNTVSESQSIRERTVSTRTQTVVSWVDPVAETFLVDQKGGMFITKVDLFFKTIDPFIPVTLQVRNTVNGYPGQRVLPLGECTLYPNNGEVNVSDDGSIATTFVFPAPVYLEESAEYAIVVLANSTKFTVYTARMGELQIGTTNLISKQPYNGVMFVSQNSSTWTAIQEEDLKFTIYRAQFNTASTGQVYFTNEEPSLGYLGASSLQTGDGINKVRVYHPNHMMPQGATHNTVVSITMPPDSTNIGQNYNGIPGINLEGDFVVGDVGLDSYTILIPGSNADATSLTGPAGITVTQHRQYDVIVPIMSEMVLPDTNTEWHLKSITGKSPHNNAQAIQEPYIKDSDWLPCALNIDNSFSAPRMIATTNNETLQVIGATALDRKSLTFRCTLTSEVDNLSPVIDTKRAAAILISNRIDDATFANSNIVGLDEEVTISSSVGSPVNFVNSGTTNKITQSGSLDFSVFKPGKYVVIAGSMLNARDYNNPAKILSVSPTELVVETVPNFSGATNLSNIQITQYRNYTSETAPRECTGAARYMTRRFKTINPNNSLKVYLTVNRPAGSYVDVYYRILKTDTNQDFNDQGYVLMEMENDGVYSESSNNEDNREYAYTADNIGSFTSFSIKIVMRGGNSSKVPVFIDLRAYGLAI